MNRSIEKKLIKWKDSARRKPLILRGARQVGKTWIVKKFGKDNFDDLVVVDFEKNKKAHAFFKDVLDPTTIIQDIEILLKTKVVPGKTLLFFDEIQSCPEAVISMRYFYEEMPKLHLIAAGSLLEFTLSKVSFPVGRVQHMNMYPMTFSEFLEATENVTAHEIVNSLPQKLPETTHNSILSELKKYFFTGGMPESVKAYAQTSSLVESFNVHDEIITSYKNDFVKYAANSSHECLEEVFTSTARNIGNQIYYSNLSNHFTNPTIKKAFDLLLKARVIKKVDSVGQLKFPLDIQTSSRKFKAVMLDIGLWQNLSGVTPEIQMAEPDLMNIYRGALAEQFVGQELTASIGKDLMYWARQARSSNAEVDYVVSVEGKIYPVEVKSGSSGSLKSLHLALESFSDCEKGVVFSTREYSELTDQKLLFLPLYYAGSFFGRGD